MITHGITCRRCGHFKLHVDETVCSQPSGMCVACEVDVKEGKPEVIQKPDEITDAIARRLLQQAGVL